jgi:hypothetical protein
MVEVQIKMLVKESMLIGWTFFFFLLVFTTFTLGSNYVGLYRKLSVSLLDFVIFSFISFLMLRVGCVGRGSSPVHYELKGILFMVEIYLKKSKGHKFVTCHFNKK